MRSSSILAVNADPDAPVIATLLADDCARTILVETRETALPVSDLADTCGVSEPTVYRRLEDLRAHDLVEERTQLVTDGNHRTVYAATPDRVTFDLSADGVEVSVSRQSSMADRFTSLVEDM